MDGWKVFDRANSIVSTLFVASGVIWEIFMRPSPLPTNAAPTTHAASGMTQWWPLAFIATGIAMLLVSSMRAWLVRRAGPRMSDWNISAINFNRFYVHPEHLAVDHYLEFVITAYNACGEKIRLIQTRGKATYTTSGGSVLTSVVYLPESVLILNREYQEQHDNLSSFQFKIQQWVPADVAAEFVSRLKAGPPITLDLSQLKIVAAPTGGPLQSALLKIADSVMLTSDQPAEAQMGVIVKAVASSASASAVMLAAAHRPVPSYIALGDAARTLYERTIDREIALFAERMDGANFEPERVLDWYAWWMTDHGVQIFGCRPPSTRRESISREKLKTLDFRDGAKILRSKHSPKDEFVNLQIETTALEAVWTELDAAAGGPREDG